MGKIITIISGKGGVGKTTTAINLGAALNYFEKDVLIIEGNLSTPNLGLDLNSPEVPVTLNHVLLKKAEPYEAVYKHYSGIKVLPASLSIKELKKIKLSKLKEFKEDFKKLADYIIIDGAAGLGEEAIASIDLADEIILVTNPELPAITNALKTMELAKEKKKKILGVLITRVKKNKIEMEPHEVKEMLETPILGMIPEDDAIPKSINRKDAVIHTEPKSDASRAYKEVTAELAGVYYDSFKDRERLFEKLTKKLNVLFGGK